MMLLNPANTFLKQDMLLSLSPVAKSTDVCSKADASLENTVQDRAVPYRPSF